MWYFCKERVEMLVLEDDDSITEDVDGQESI